MQGISPKTRGNYAISKCFREDCKNRPKKCDNCRRWDEYEPRDGS